MPSFNSVILAGNLTADPEIRYVGAKGSAVVKFTLAVNNTRTRAAEDTQFVDVVAWGKLAEICNTYLRSGMPALVEGRLDIRSYTARDGVRRKGTQVVINSMQMLSKNPAAAGAGQAADVADQTIDDEIPW